MLLGGLQMNTNKSNITCHICIYKVIHYNALVKSHTSIGSISGFE